MKTIKAFTIFCILLMACTGEKSDLQSLDLLQYGVPITINAPEGAEVAKGKGLINQEVRVDAGEDYGVIVSMGDALVRDAAKIKQDRLESVKEHRFFFRIVQEDEHGFIYENRIDSMNSTFGFNYFKIEGDKEYGFENNRSSMFNLEQVEKMYSSVK